jgi:hypothetical protein
MNIIVIRGGVLQAVYDVPPPNKSFNGDDTWLVDWDNIACGDTAVRLDPSESGSLPSEVVAQIPGWFAR